jgi:hypothetical protein
MNRLGDLRFKANGCILSSLGAGRIDRVERAYVTREKVSGR